MLERLYRPRGGVELDRDEVAIASEQNEERGGAPLGAQVSGVRINRCKQREVSRESIARFKKKVREIWRDGRGYGKPYVRWCGSVPGRNPRHSTQSSGAYVGRPAMLPATALWNRPRPCRSARCRALPPRLPALHPRPAPRGSTPRAPSSSEVPTDRLDRIGPGTSSWSCTSSGVRSLSCARPW